ncbi:MAG: hypothetical protein RLZ98_354 [Pseudomonadota bacterium]
MPTLVIAVVIAGVAGAWAGYRYVSRRRARVAEAEAEAKAASGPRDHGNLVWDEKSQSYRPKG